MSAVFRDLSAIKRTAEISAGAATWRAYYAGFMWGLCLTRRARRASVQPRPDRWREWV